MPDDAELLSLCHGDRTRADAVKGQLQALRRGERFFSVRAARRIFSNLTSLKRGARKHLRVRGEPLWHVDLPCCHLLALSLQRWEANLVVFRICDRIRRERPDVWIGTIHDAIVCLEKDVPFGLGVVEQELKALGVTLAPGKLVGKAM